MIADRIKQHLYSQIYSGLNSTRIMLPSAKKGSVPTTQKCCVVYEFSCRCEARYVGRTTQRVADNKTKCPNEHQEEK